MDPRPSGVHRGDEDTFETVAGRRDRDDVAAGSLVDRDEADGLARQLDDDLVLARPEQVHGGRHLVPGERDRPALGGEDDRADPRFVAGLGLEAERVQPCVVRCGEGCRSHRALLRGVVV